MFYRASIVVLVVVLMTGCLSTDEREPTPVNLPTAAAPAPTETEILWDQWGVPHIYAQSEADLAYAFGWAQTHSHGNLMLHLYAEARGCAAEYFGEEFVAQDRTVRTYGIPDLAAQWYEQQSERHRELLDQFAAGVNDYAAQHPNTVDPEVAAVLPINGTDLLAHTLRSIYFTFVSNTGHLTEQWLKPGSNGWIINSTVSASGNPILLGNPHLPWSDMYLFYEFHFGAPAANEFYGTTLVGLPAPMLGFNHHMGWTLTVNTYDGSDLYDLVLSEDGEGYLFDGETRPFETREQMLKVKQPDGTLRQEVFTVRRSVHGPVVAEKDDSALALRVAGLERPGMLEQWWDMSKATSLETFEEALRRLQFPMSNVLYADGSDNILLLFNGLIPVRSQGDWHFWRGIVPGNTSDTLWREYHAYDDLPRVANPSSGWLGSSNEPPWYMTIPYPLDPTDFPPYFSPPEADPWDFRWQYARRLLAEQPTLTFDDLLAAKFSSHSELADRVLDDLIAAARGSSDKQVQQAAVVLAEWDRAYTASSRGALLFSHWVRAYKQLTEQPFAEPWSNDAPPLTVPRGLGDTEAAIAALSQAFDETVEQAGTPDAAWGEVIRMVVGEHDLPASGGSGEETVRVLEAVTFPDGSSRVVYGDTFIFAVEFAEPLRALALLLYGNATQPGSPHIGDQLEHYARDEMRPALLTREEIEASLETRETLR